MEKSADGNPSLLTDELLVRVRGREFRILLKENRTALINGVVHTFDFVDLDNGTSSLILDDEMFSVYRKPGKVSLDESLLSVRGNLYPYVIDDRRSLLRKSLLPNQPHKKKDEILRAPMPGLVLKVEVNVDAEIRKGQGLVVLEAMKMENEIKATEKGKVEKIHVSPGQVVEKGEPLISIVRD